MIVYPDLTKIWVWVWPTYIRTHIFCSQTNKSAWLMLKQNYTGSLLQWARTFPLKPNNFRNCLEKVVVKWQICGLEIKDQHLRRSDKKSWETEREIFGAKSGGGDIWALDLAANRTRSEKELPWEDGVAMKAWQKRAREKISWPRKCNCFTKLPKSWALWWWWRWWRGLQAGDLKEFLEGGEGGSH